MSDVTTIHRDLRTGCTVWQAGDVPEIAMTAPTGVIEADVLVVGAGITGATVADVLSEAGFKVVLAERRRPLRGSTMATTALIQFELDTPLLELGKMIGERHAQRAWLRSKQAVEHLTRRVSGIGCDWMARESLYLSGNELNGEQLRDESDARAAIGLPVEFLESRSLSGRYGINREGAIRAGGNAECNPVLLAAGLLERAFSRGAVVYGPTEIVELTERGDGVIAKDKAGVTFRAGHIIYATGYEMPDIVPQAHSNGDSTQVNSTWAMATRPQPDKLWPTKCTVWEAADPYLYVRSTPDGRIIAGGEDEEFSDAETRDAMIGAKTKALEEKLGALLPGIDPAAEFAWTGSFGSTETGMPMIGLIPGQTRSYAVMGFGGNGITFGVIAAELLRAAVLGERDPDADLFAFR